MEKKCEGAKDMSDKRFLVCEQKSTYWLLIMAAGMMGAYTFNLRGGVFCNAQTANIVMMSIAFGKGRLGEGVYYLIPIFAYMLGAFVSEILPSPLKKLGHVRWDTCLIGIEIAVLFGIGFIPLQTPHQIVQILVNFIASMQYNTFRQAEGIPMATTFCTNHVRQVGVGVAKWMRKRDRAGFLRGMLHLLMLAGFFAGGVLLTFFCDPLQEKAIWIALIPLAIIFTRMIHADLVSERGMLEQKPGGH